MTTRFRAIDLFCGGGGASHGLRDATGQSPRIAVNHDPAAIRMHQANHPKTIHLQDDIWAIDPVRIAQLRRMIRGRIDHLHGSPDCRFFSRARGGKPMEKSVRVQPMVMLRWVRELLPRVVTMENVAEILRWGPLHPPDHPDPKKRNRPIKEREGEDWRRFVGRLELYGYRVEWKILKACDYGAPTTRERLMLVARLDGKPQWPEPTHGPGRPLPWRTAAECIDWSIPAPSIFTRKRPLAENTHRRIARGLEKFVLACDNPYILEAGSDGSLAPYIARLGHTSSDSGKFHSLQRPLSTITSKNEHLLITPSLTKFYGTSTGSPMGAPVPTITAGGGHLGLLAPWLINTRNGERPGQRPRVRDIQRPLGTVTAVGSQGAVCAAWLAKHYTGATGSSLRDPIGSITAKDHHSLVAAFLTKYYGQGSQAQGLSEPMHTIVSKARFGLVTVNLAGEEYAVVDIGMRMLQPHELARAQGFADDYILTGTKTEQIARIGRSVPPQMVEALVRANHPKHAR